MLLGPRRSCLSLCPTIRQSSGSDTRMPAVSGMDETRVKYRSAKTSKAQLNRIWRLPTVRLYLHATCNYLVVVVYRRYIPTRTVRLSSVGFTNSCKNNSEFNLEPARRLPCATNVNMSLHVTILQTLNWNATAVNAAILRVISTLANWLQRWLRHVDCGSPPACLATEGRQPFDVTARSGVVKCQVGAGGGGGGAAAGSRLCWVRWWLDPASARAGIDGEFWHRNILLGTGAATTTYSTYIQCTALCLERPK